MTSFARPFLFLILQFLLLPPLPAQVYPLQVTTTITPPYTPYLSDYVAPGAQKLMVQVSVNDPTLENYQCRFRVTIEGLNITLRTKEHMVVPPVTLQGGGVPQIFYGEDLIDYFKADNLDFSGLSRNDYGRSGKLPEGVYRISIEVLDYHRGTVVSNKGATMVWMVLNDPPLLNLPRDGSKVEAIDPVTIPFSWTPRQTGSPNSAFSTEYTFRLVEVWPDGRNPNDAMLVSTPLYETTTNMNALVYGPAEPALIPGRTYAWQVQAKAVTMGAEPHDLFRNEGKSEVYTFRFGDEVGMPQNLRKEGGNTSTLTLRWEPATEGVMPDDYRIRYRPVGNDEWYEQSSRALWTTVTELTADTPYEVEVRAERGGYFSDYTDVQLVRTAAEERKAYTCGVQDIIPPVENTSPLQLLRPGDVIKCGDFSVVVSDAALQGNLFSGKGVMQVPFLNEASVWVNFSGRINTDYRLILGEVASVYEQGSEGAQLIDSAQHIGHEQPPSADTTETAPAPQPDTTINVEPLVINVPGTIDTVTVAADGTITVVDDSGNTTTYHQPVDSVSNEPQPVTVADAAGNEYTVGKDGKVVRSGGGGNGNSGEPSFQEPTQEEIDAFTIAIIKFYKEEVSDYLDQHPSGQGGHGPVLAFFPLLAPELAECFKSRTEDLPYVEDFLNQSESDSKRRGLLEEGVRNGGGYNTEVFQAIIKDSRKSSNAGKDIGSLISESQYQKINDDYCSYVLDAAQTDFVYTALEGITGESPWGVHTECFLKGVTAAIATPGGITGAALAAMVATTKCYTERGRCGDDWGAQFECGFANGLADQLDIQAMVKGIVDLTITQLKNEYDCFIKGGVITIPVAENNVYGGFHLFSKCVLGVDLRVEQYQKLYQDIVEYVKAHWDDPYVDGQATSILVTLVTPLVASKIGKVGLLARMGELAAGTEELTEIEKLADAAGDVEKVEEVLEEGRSFTTLIDDEVEILPKEELNARQAESFANSDYFTVRAKRDILVFRRFGGNAKLGGVYASTEAKLSREELALVKEFNNSMRFEATIRIPGGEKFSLGKVGPWPPNSPEYMGGADQIILEHRFPENVWVESVKDYKTGKIYKYGAFKKAFPNLCR